jgi:hypothetical protein
MGADGIQRYLQKRRGISPVTLQSYTSGGKSNLMRGAALIEAD